MPQILLINPPNPPGQTANREGSAGMGVLSAQPDAFCYPPHTLATVAAVLRQAEYEVSCIDAVAEKLSLEETLLRTPSIMDDVQIGVFVSQATQAADVNFINALVKEAPRADIVAFGPAMRFIGRDVMKQSQVTAVAMGDPETSVLETFQALVTPETDSNNSVWISGPAASQTELAQLPRPAWDLLPHDAYPFLTLRAGRGCDDDCAYCPYVAIEGHGRKTRAASDVADELAWLAESFPKARYVFRDIVFAADRAWVEAFCESVRSKRLKVAWECESRPEHFDETLLRLMVKAGCSTIKIGLETVDDDMLELTGRLRPNQTAEEYRDSVLATLDAAQQANIACRVFVMVGFPGETYSARAQTREFLAAVRPPLLSIKPYRGYTGVRLELDGFSAKLNARPGARALTHNELHELQREWQGFQGDPLPPQGLGNKIARMFGWNQGRSYQVSARRGRRLS